METEQREKTGTLVDRLRKQAEVLAYYRGLNEGQAARIAALEVKNARLLEACQKAREWLNRVGANSPVIFGGEAELDEQLRAALWYQ